ncbi:hypothetical protein KDA_01320 [Dictyobacter alpinus]|uniref:Uncharacterized protein n=1 Tax=Dictyobacter alpinus TaxID=2014873 RepID=A0A402AZX8_9CHLR|nr:hypothetical protein KDA_01320 [Dictyobacter alpinus]
MAHIITFSHPDFTVGFGFSPNLSLVDIEVTKERLAGSAQHLLLFHTAGREFHPAPKVLFAIKYATNRQVYASAFSKSPGALILNFCI